MEKSEQTSDFKIKNTNQAESKELSTMKQKISELRHQVGVIEEQQMELNAQKNQILQMIQGQKQAFRDRIQNIAKSYEIELGVFRDGKVWQFDEPSLSFVQNVIKNQSVLKNEDDVPPQSATN